MVTLPVPCLCLVTRRDPGGEDALVARVAAVVKGGVAVVQVREKDLSGGHLLGLVHRLQRVTAERALLVVNERVDVALSCGADGVQLGEEAMPVAEGRRLVGQGMLIGRSVHGAAGAVMAEQQGADFLIVGTIFPTDSKPGAETAGVALLREIGQRVHIPYLAIGGINAGNAGQVMAAGASGVAVIGALLDVPDPQEAAASLARVVRDAWSLQVETGAGQRQEAG